MELFQSILLLIAICCVSMIVLNKLLDALCDNAPIFYGILLIVATVAGILGLWAYSDDTSINVMIPGLLQFAYFYLHAHHVQKEYYLTDDLTIEDWPAFMVKFGVVAVLTFIMMVLGIIWLPLPIVLEILLTTIHFIALVRSSGY